MRRLVTWAIGLLLVVAALVYGAIGWVMVDVAVEAERVPLKGTPAAVGMAFEEVTFSPRGDEDLTLRGWHVPAPEGPAAAEGTVVLVHGVDSNRARDGDVYLRMARGLHDAGFDLLFFDLRAHGESDGEIVSASVFESHDVLGALDFVTEVKGARWERLGVLSFSLGAASALLAAEEEPRLRAVVADSSWADFSDILVKEAADRTPLSPTAVRVLRPGMEALAKLRYGIDLSLARPVRAIAALDYPLLLIHSEEDERFPADYSRRLKAAARDPETELWVSPEGEHARVYEVDVEEYVRRVAGYFKRRFAALDAGVNLGVTEEVRTTDTVATGAEAPPAADSAGQTTEGVKVRTGGSLEVLDPDGTVVERREFED